MPSPSTFPGVLRELVRTHQAFLAYADLHAQSLDLTLPQFDIILALGNTTGITFQETGRENLNY